MRFLLAPAMHVLRTLIINVITGVVATALVINRRRNPNIEPRAWPPEQPAPYVQIIIPVRDEERNIGALLETLLAQTYPHGRWGITVVDDASQDRTQAIVRTIVKGHPSVKLIRARALPPGWTGKNHALMTGAMDAPPSAVWLLFLDADTRHHPQMLSSVMQRALACEADMLSLVTRVEMNSFWERVLVPQVGEMYTLLVGTMDAVNRPGRRAAANGQFILVRRSLYLLIGALDSVRSDVAEDRALAQAAKDRGYKVRLDYGLNLVSTKVYSTLAEMWAGYSRTIFWASGHNVPRTIAVAVALTLYTHLPLLVLLYALIDGKAGSRSTALRHAFLQLGPMLALRAYVCGRHGVPVIYALAYPLSVAMGNAILLHSLYRVVSGKGVWWKGRVYR